MVTSDLIGSIACFAICLMFLFLIAGCVNDYIKHNKKSGTASAKILRVDQVPRVMNGSHQLAHMPLLHYVVDGKSYRVRWEKGHINKGYVPGQTITIRYSESDPEDIYIPGDWGMSEYLIIYFFTFVAVAYGWAIFSGEYFLGIDLRFWT